MYANDITGLAEDAVQAYIRLLVPTRIPYGQIYTGLDDEKLALPRVVCLCQEAERIIQPDGNYDAKMQVIVRTSADDTTRQAHRDLAGEVFSLFNSDREDVADAISQSLTGFSVDDILTVSSGWDKIVTEQTRSWKSWTIYTLKCRGSD